MASWAPRFFAFATHRSAYCHTSALSQLSCVVERSSAFPRTPNRPFFVGEGNRYLIVSLFSKLSRVQVVPVPSTMYQVTKAGSRCDPTLANGEGAGLPRQRRPRSSCVLVPMEGSGHVPTIQTSSTVSGEGRPIKNGTVNGHSPSQWIW